MWYFVARRLYGKSQRVTPSRNSVGSVYTTHGGDGAFMNNTTTDWDSIDKVSSVATTSGRYIGKKPRSYANGFDGMAVNLRLRDPFVLERLKSITEFTCMHKRFFFAPCHNCHRDKESAAFWAQRLLPRLIVFLGLKGKGSI